MTNTKIFLSIDKILSKQPELAGKLTGDEIRSLKKPMFKDPDHILRFMNFIDKHGDRFPIPGFSKEEVQEWQDNIQEINVLEEELVDILQTLRHGRLLWNDKFWSLVSKVYQYLRVMGKDFPELWEDGSFIEDLMKERAKRGDSEKSSIVAKKTT